jgi:tetratricopeptide (TPR) repeat protein
MLLCIGLLGWATAAWAAYPQDAVDKTHIIQLLKADRFAELDTLFSRLQDGYELGKVDELTVMYAFQAFAAPDPALQVHLEKWENQSPDSFAMHEALGDYHQQLGWVLRGGGRAKDLSRHQLSGMVDHFRIAEHEYSQALALRPKLIPAYAGLISIYNGVGLTKLQKQAMLKALLLADPASYLIHYQYLYALQPKWGGSFAAMADYLKQKVRPYESQNPMLKSLEGFPHYVRADELYCGCGDGGIFKVDLAAAEKEISAALKAGMNPMYVWEQADIYRAEGKFSKAVDSYSRALEQRPQNTGILTGRGWSYYGLGDYDHALQDYDRALYLDPRASDALRDRGILYYAQKQLDNAKNDLEASLAYGNGDISIYRYLGYIEFTRKDFQGAEERLGKAIEMGDHDAEDYFYLAASQWKDKKCSFVKIARAYLQLCSEQGDCKPDNMRWARGDADYAVSKGICPQ